MPLFGLQSHCQFGDNHVYNGNLQFVSHLSDVARCSLGEIQSIGEFFEGTGVQPRNTLRSYPSFGLTLVTQGKGRFFDKAGGSSDLAKGSVILTLPRALHWFGPDAGDTWDEIYVSFDGPIFEFLRNHGRLIPSRRILQVDDWKVLRAKIEALKEKEPLEAIMSLVVILEQLMEPLPVNKDPAWVVLAKQKLSTNLEKEVDLAEIAQDLRLGYETFRKDFRSVVGMGPGRFRLCRRLDLGRALLFRSGMTLEEISARTGYSDSFAFSKAFRREFGRSPSAWRAESLDGRD